MNKAPQKPSLERFHERIISWKRENRNWFALHLRNDFAINSLNINESKWKRKAFVPVATSNRDLRILQKYQIIENHIGV